MTDTRFAVMGVSKRTGENSFLYVARNGAGWMDSTVDVWKTDYFYHGQVLEYSANECRRTIERIKEITSDNISEKFYNFKVIRFEFDYDLVAMKINVKLFEVMDDDSLIELGNEYD